MSNIIRKISLFLLCAVFLNLTGCGLVVINYDKFGNGETAETVTSTTQEEETAPPVNVVTNDYSDEIEKNLLSIPDTQYENAVFKIVSPDTSSLNPDADMDFLSETVVVRNNAVSEKHSVSIVSTQVDYASLYAEVYAAVNSGMYYSDLMMLPQEMIGSFAAGGLLLNMRSMPSLDFEASYFNQSSVGAAAGGFNSYAIGGYASTYPYSLPVVFFNKALCNGAKVDMYKLVETGEWTWDKFFIISDYASIDEGYFSWGTAELGDAVYETAFVSCGNTIVNSGIMQVPSLSFNPEETTATENILKLLYKDKGSIHTNEDAQGYFSSGVGFFLFEKLGMMNAIRGSKTEWGIVPMPKATSTGSYSTLAGPDSLLFTCPVTVSTPDKSATILMSLNAASEGIIKDAYISNIQYNYLRDNDSANMLDIVIDSVVYDFSYSFGSTYDGIASGTYDAIRQSALPDESLTTIINQRSAALNRAFNSNFSLSN